MIDLVICSLIQATLLLLLCVKNRNDGGKDLFRDQHWGSRDIVVLIGFLNVSAYFIRFTSSGLQPYGSLRDNIFFGPHLIRLLFAVCFIKLILRQSLGALGLRREKAFSAIVLAGLLLIFGCIILQPLTDYGKLLRCLKFMALLLILGPFTEEIVYRGLLYSPYRKKFGPMGGALITAIFFQASHLEALLYANIYGLLVGIVLAWIYERKESLAYPLAVHTAINIPAAISLTGQLGMMGVLK